MFDNGPAATGFTKNRLSRIAEEVTLPERLVGLPCRHTKR